MRIKRSQLAIARESPKVIEIGSDAPAAAPGLELGENIFHRADFGDGVYRLPFEADGGNRLSARRDERVLRACGRLVRINRGGQATGQAAWLNRQLGCGHESRPSLRGSF